MVWWVETQVQKGSGRSCCSGLNLKLTKGLGGVRVETQAQNSLVVRVEPQVRSG